MSNEHVHGARNNQDEALNGTTDHLIGVYDSGMGGISVLRAIHTLLPLHDLCYLADTAFCPYGPRPAHEVRERALACAGWLVDHGARVVVVACNTASAVALELLRAALPVPIVGMEPAIKPAIAVTRTRQVGVLATGGTLASERLASLIRRFAHGVTVHMVPCPDLVAQVEAGELKSPHTCTLVQHYLASLELHHVDTIVLGCSHFHFLKPLISELVAPHVTIIETSRPVAQQVVRVATAIGLTSGKGYTQAATTAHPKLIGPVVDCLWGDSLPLEQAIISDYDSNSSFAELISEHDVATTLDDFAD